MGFRSKKAALSAVILLFTILLPLAAHPADQADILGDWAGTLSVSGMKVRLIFHITESSEGTLSATMDSPDQGAAGIPASEVTFDGDSLAIMIGVAQAGYHAKYDPDSLVIEGEWRQAGYVLPLRLERAGDIEPLSRPQEPKRPLPYKEENVEFINNEAGITLAGTLTIPEGAGPFPAVVLITGSGPQDRDESLLGHKPFFVLSDHLTRNGIAVLRYDDRGIGESGGDHGSATTADFATDAGAAFDFLAAREDTDPKMIGLAGHSEGGIVAAMVAAGNEGTGFIVLLAGPGVSGADILLKQNLELLRYMGAPEEVISKRRDQLELEYGFLDEHWPDDDTEKAIITVSTAFLEKYTIEERETYGFSESAVRQRAEQLVTPWLRFFMLYDPASALRQVECPVLAMIGEKDIQVDPGENLPAIEKALKDGGNKAYTVKMMPGLNHLFQTAETGSPTEYAEIEETMSPAALDMVSGWILSLKTGGK